MQESRASILDIGPLARRSFLTLIHASNRRGSESLEQSYDSCCWSSGFVFISLSLSSSVRRKRVEAGMRNCRATKYATRYAGASRRRSRRCDSSCALAAASKSAMSPSDAKPALARAYFPASELDSSVVAASACATNSQDVLASAARSSTTRLHGDINAAALAFIVATRSSVAALVDMRAGCRFVRAPQAQRLRNVCTLPRRHAVETAAVWPLWGWGGVPNRSGARFGVIWVPIKCPMRLMSRHGTPGGPRGCGAYICTRD